MFVRILRLNFTLPLKRRSAKTVSSLCNDVIGYVSECLQIVCWEGTFQNTFTRMKLAVTVLLICLYISLV